MPRRRPRPETPRSSVVVYELTIVHLYQNGEICWSGSAEKLLRRLRHAFPEVADELHPAATLRTVVEHLNRRMQAYAFAVRRAAPACKWP